MNNEAAVAALERHLVPEQTMTLAPRAQEGAGTSFGTVKLKYPNLSDPEKMIWKPGIHHLLFFVGQSRGGKQSRVKAKQRKNKKKRAKAKGKGKGKGE